MVYNTCSLTRYWLRFGNAGCEYTVKCLTYYVTLWSTGCQTQEALSELMSTKWQHRRLFRHTSKSGSDAILCGPSDLRVLTNQDWGLGYIFINIDMLFRAKSIYMGISFVVHHVEGNSGHITFGKKDKKVHVGVSFVFYLFFYELSWLCFCSR